MRKEKDYYKTFFSVPVIQEAISIIGEINKINSPTFTIKTRDEEWNFNSIEEFFAEYVKHDFEYAHLRIISYRNKLLEMLVFKGRYTKIAIGAATRNEIDAIFQVFENNLDKSKIAIDTTVKKDPIKVFIGHGHDEQWKLLKDHLHDSHGIDVTAYEIGPRAGLTIKEVLEDMLNKSSIAFLVLTGEDINNYGELHARQNVVHELGLFQGRLGFKRAIALLEDGVTEFSNINGVNQIRFSKGNIRETFGDVVATIKREFEK